MLDASTEMFAENTRDDNLNDTRTTLSHMSISNSMCNIRKFDPSGAVSIRNWIKYFEKKTAALTENERVQIFSDYLEGSALDLFIEEFIDVTNWDEIKVKMMDNFANDERFTFTDFTELKFLNCKDLREYYSRKIAIGKSLNLSPSILLQGLTDGLPERKKELLLMRDISSTSDWLRLAQRVIKPFPEQREMPRRFPDPQSLQAEGNNFRQRSPRNINRRDDALRSYSNTYGNRTN